MLAGRGADQCVDLLQTAFRLPFPNLTAVLMQNSSVLIVHPSDHRFRLPDMANGTKFTGRHFSLDSPGSLTSPPGYEHMLEHKPPTAAATLASFSMPTTSGQISSASQPFGQLNPHLVYPSAHTAGLLPLSKSTVVLRSYIRNNYVSA